MYFLFSVEKKKIPDAIGRYSDRLGPRPKMRSVAYRCVAFMRLKIISHRHSIESEKYFPMCDRDGGACDIFSHIIYENTIHIYSKIVPCVFPYLQCHMHLYVSAIYIAVVIFFIFFCCIRFSCEACLPLPSVIFPSCLLLFRLLLLYTVKCWLPLLLLLPVLPVFSMSLSVGLSALCVQRVHTDARPTQCNWPHMPTLFHLY